MASDVQFGDNTDRHNFHFGSTQVDSIYFGAQQVWSNVISVSFLGFPGNSATVTRGPAVPGSSGFTALSFNVNAGSGRGFNTGQGVTITGIPTGYTLSGPTYRNSANTANVAPGNTTSARANFSITTDDGNYPDSGETIDYSDLNVTVTDSPVVTRSLTASGSFPLFSVNGCSAFGTGSCNGSIVGRTGQFNRDQNNCGARRFTFDRYRLAGGSNVNVPDDTTSVSIPLPNNRVVEDIRHDGDRHWNVQSFSSREVTCPPAFSTSAACYELSYSINNNNNPGGRFSHGNNDNPGASCTISSITATSAFARCPDSAQRRGGITFTNIGGPVGTTQNRCIFSF